MSENSQAVTSPTITRHEHIAGQVIGRHRHAFHQLIYVSTGVLAVQTGEASWVASNAQAMWIPADTWHQHRVYGPSRVHTIGFAPDDAPLPPAAPNVVSVEPLLRELLIARSDPDLPTPEADRLQAVMRDRLQRSHVQPLTLPTPRGPRLVRACELAAGNLAQLRTVTWLARQTGVGERTLSRLFRAEFGMTYPQWRTITRVFHAMIQLAEGATVTETGRRCGWATTSAFIDTFTRTIGQTPGGYRAAACGIARHSRTPEKKLATG
ncbi:AraC family transcriptional regulator [Streptomyces cavernae]|uniref:AraC family transcriptional regulator n=1 Tax=Streptomyces cavernae TaxID=2259034 RepID=UPI000FEBE96E|nr:helix-turn-helix transcriptional regulator [Streptomyces cavernae]